MDAARPIQVLLVDDSAVFRQTMRDVLAVYPNLELIGEATTASEAVEMAARLHPAVVLMDIHLGRVMDGIAATRLLSSQSPRVAILGLSWDTREYVISAMRQAGALDVLQKEQAPNEMHEAILRAVASMYDE